MMLQPLNTFRALNHKLDNVQETKTNSLLLQMAEVFLPVTGSLWKLRFCHMINLSYTVCLLLHKTFNIRWTVWFCSHHKQIIAPHCYQWSDAPPGTFKKTKWSFLLERHFWSDLTAVWVHAGSLWFTVSTPTHLKGVLSGGVQGSVQACQVPPHAAGVLDSLFGGLSQ